MSKGNSRRKQVAQYQKQRKKTENEKESAELAQRKFENIQNAEKLSDLSYHLFQTKCLNWLKRFALVVMFALLVALAGGLVWLLVSYIRRDNTLAPILFNVVQCLMGVVSLVVGFWGWVLALNSNRKTNQSSLRIDSLPATRNPNPFTQENDVDKSKL